MLCVAGRCHVELAQSGSLESALNALTACQDEMEAITEITLDSNEAGVMFLPLLGGMEKLAKFTLKQRNDVRLSKVRRELEDWLLSSSGRDAVRKEGLKIQVESERHSLDLTLVPLTVEESERRARTKIISERMSRAIQRVPKSCVEALEWVRRAWIVCEKHLGQKHPTTAKAGYDLAVLLLAHETEERERRELLEKNKTKKTNRASGGSSDHCDDGTGEKEDEEDVLLQLVMALRDQLPLLSVQTLRVCDPLRQGQ